MPLVQVKRMIALNVDRKKNYHQYTDDPVTYGIVGVSAGFAYPQLDKERNLKNDFAPAFTLGLYFTEQFSTRLGYMQGNYESTVSNEKHIYENYSLDVQYYFMPGSAFKPYLNAGVGEAMLDKDRDTKKATMEHWYRRSLFPQCQLVSTG